MCPDATALAYHVLKGCIGRFGHGPAGVDAARRRQVEHTARTALALESAVLSTAEAAAVTAPDHDIDAAVAEIAGRYPDRARFRAALAASGLDEESYRTMVGRELRFDAVMTLVASRAPAVSEAQVRAAYDAAPQRFTAPEIRTARHILVTVNDAYPENTRPAAKARIDALADEVRHTPSDFERLARRCSECPTALEGGRLGTMPRGQMYPEIDDVLFALGEGAVGGPVETAIGFHLVLCEAIRPARTVSYEDAAPRIRRALVKRGQRQYQRAWLAGIGALAMDGTGPGLSPCAGSSPTNRAGPLPG